MPHRLPWIERRFAFDLPMWACGATIRRPCACVLGALGRSRRTADTCSSSKGPGGRLDDFAAGLSHLRPAEMSNASTDAAAYNSRDGGEVLEQFRLARGRSVRRLEALEGSQLERSAHHPRLDQSMRIERPAVLATSFATRAPADGGRLRAFEPTKDCLQLRHSYER